MEQEQVKELVLQALETERGGVQVYETALECVSNEDVREEWQEYLEQTKRHVEIVEELCAQLGVDTEEETPGREIVRYLGESLVGAMRLALEGDAPREAVELVACECVVLAETKDHLNWELIGQCAHKTRGDDGKALAEASEEVEDEEDEHLYHTRGWCRELWIQSLGMAAVLPPPEEKKDVKTAIGAARAQSARKDMLKKGSAG